MKFITKMRNAPPSKAGGWVVRIAKTPNSPKSQKKSYSGFFSHLAYGGERKSLEAARKYRDEIAIECGRHKEKVGQSISRGRYTDYKPTASGIAGVVYEIGRRGEYPSEAYVVHWTEVTPGGERWHRKRRFGWGTARCKYDTESQALKAAKKLRKEMVKLHYIGRRKLKAE